MATQTREKKYRPHLNHKYIFIGRILNSLQYTHTHMEGIVLAQDTNWDSLERWLKVQHEDKLETSDDFGMSLLHWILTEHKVPYVLVTKVVEMNSNCLLYRNHAGMIPLHIAIHSKLPANILQYLVNACPKSMRVVDGKGRSPLDIASSRNLPSHSISILRSSGKGSFEKDAVDVTHQLSLVLEQLQMMNGHFKTKSPRSSTASTSSLSSSSSGLKHWNGKEVFYIDWHPNQKLGLSLEAMEGRNGAKIKRIVDATIVPGVMSLMVGDVLATINGSPVQHWQFKDIVDSFQTNATKVVQFGFMRYESIMDSDENSVLYTKVLALLSETLRSVHQAEDALKQLVG